MIIIGMEVSSRSDSVRSMSLLHDSNSSKKFDTDSSIEHDHKSNILGSVYSVTKQLLDELVDDELIEVLVM